MTSNDQQIDLVINRLKRAQYEELYQQGKIDETQLYIITDDPTTPQVVSSYLSDYYPKSETSSAVEIQTAFDNIPEPDLSEYAKLSALNTLSSEVDPISYDVIVSDGYYRVYADKMNNLTSVSDHMKIVLDNYDFSKSYVMKFNTPTHNEIHFDFYVDNGSGPQFDSEMNINKSYSFPMNSGYVVEVKFDAMDIRPLAWNGDRQKMTFRTIEWVEED